MTLCATSVLSLSSVVNVFATGRTGESRFPILGPNDVHVWRIPLTEDISRDVLSSDERERAARFHFEKHRHQFVGARAALRFILGEYLGVAPEKIELVNGVNGKPELANGVSDLRFNLSRREGLALVAVTRGREIGVDVERVRSDFPIMEVAEASFSVAEFETLRNLPETQRVAGFYNCWTRKEAYVKARGEGLSFPLKQFDVSLNPGGPAKLLNVRGDDSEVNRWTMQDIPVGERYVAALAVEGSGLSVTSRELRKSIVETD